MPRQRDGSGADRARLRNLAARGMLGALSAGERRRLLPAALEVAYPIVYDVLTRRVARNRGHGHCAHSLHQMEESCLDGFHADLESVAAHLLAATTPITDLEGWLARSAQHAAIDGHRRRRGEQGALQRPRMTRALAEALGDDPWLKELALKILVWVGVPAGVGATLWPLDSWVRDRAELTGDHRGSTTAQVQADVGRVLEAMSRRPAWYEKNVERPLGRKTTPVAGSPGDLPGQPRPLLAGDSGAGDPGFDDLATLAVLAIRAALARGDDPTTTVVRVLATLYLSGTGADEIDRVPGAGTRPDERVSALLGDPAALSVLVQRVLGIVRGTG